MEDYECVGSGSGTAVEPAFRAETEPSPSGESGDVEAGASPRGGSGPRSSSVSFASAGGAIAVDIIADADGPCMLQESSPADVGYGGSVRFRDDSSLQRLSSSLRFRGSSLRIVEQIGSQLVLEEKLDDLSGVAGDNHEGESRGDGGDDDDGNDNGSNDARRNDGGDDGKVREITVKTVADDTFSHLALRSLYSLVTVFFGGFLFIFCLQIILFLFMDIVAQANTTNSPLRNGIHLVSALLSIPVCVHGLSSTMTLATGFVVDTWRGHRISSWVGWEEKSDFFNVVISEWVSFVVYIAVPAITAICTLFAGLENWWAISLLAWYCSIFVFWCVFAAVVFQSEMSTCLALVREMDGPSSSLSALIRRAILTVQARRWSGYTRSTYLVNSQQAMNPLARRGSYKASGAEPFRKRKSMFSRATMWMASRGGAESGGCCYAKLETPERQVTFSDMMGSAPVVTANSWSLEKVFCRKYEQNAIIVVGGPSAVSRAQRKSSIICVAIANILLLLILAALLAWMNVGALLIIGLVAVILICCIPNIKMLRSSYQFYKDVKEKKRVAEENVEVESQAIYQVTETLRITRPTDALCWWTFSLSIVFFYIWPLVALFASKNVIAGVVFLLFCIFSGARRYLNVVGVLKELGSFDFLDRVVQKWYIEASKRWLDANDGIEESANSERERWKAKSRLVYVLGSISRGGVRDLWRAVFWGLAIVFGIMACAAIGLAPKQNSSILEMRASLNDFYYMEQPGLAYPTCELKKGFQVDEAFVSTDSLADAVYLAALVYNDPFYYPELLEKWFGNGVANDNRVIVKEFQGTYYPNSPMRYMLTTFPDIPGVGVVSIRGTVNLLDMFVDMQLWSAAALAQGLRGLLPVSSMWTPVLKQLVWTMSVVETQSLMEHAYYKEIVGFVQNLMRREEFNRVIITGHSLGGGLAIISGAQAGVRAIGISGPNAMLSRRSFDPPVTADQLNSLTFNVIPNGDIVPMIDDRARLFQEIDCRAPKNNLFGCHDVLRSLCDIQYHCGSGRRPAMCACALKFGYPEPWPIKNGTKSFKDACIEEYPDYEGEI